MNQDNRKEVIYSKCVKHTTSDMDKKLERGERFTTVSTGGLYNESLVVDNVTGKSYTLADYLKR